MTISSAGIGSGLDVNSIVTQLMALEQKPLTSLATKESTYQSQISALGQLKSALAAVDTAAATLRSTAAAPAWKTSVTTPGIVTASASAGATAGMHTLSVSNLAQTQILAAAGRASSSAPIGTGAATTLTFDFGTIAGGAFDNTAGTYAGASFTPNAAKTPFTITLDNSNNTLDQIRDAINAAGGGVTAAVVNDGGTSPYRLVLTSASTGADSSLRIVVNGDATLTGLLAQDPAASQRLSETQTAQDARFVLDGLAISKTSNNITDVLAGVTLTLTGTNAPGSTSLGVQRNSAPLASALGALVNAYNSLNSAVAGYTKAKAVLQGDLAAQSAQRQVRSALGNAPAGVSGSYTLLAQLGGSFQKDGSLTFDTAKFQAAVDADPTAVNALAGSIASSVKDAAAAFSAADGPVAGRIDGLNRSIADIDKRRIQIQHHLDQVETQYRAQFGALDTLLSSLKSTSNFLTQQLANLPGSSNNKG